MKNTFGSDLSLTIFGESHGRAIGAVLDGMAAGLPVDEAFLAACMDKRRARGDGLSTPRVEADAVQLLSGVVNGRTTGTAIALMIENTNTRSGDYAKTADLLRPRPCRLHRLRQVPRLSGRARRRALLRPGDGRPCGGRCHCAERTAPCGHRHHHPYRRVRWHCGHPLCAGRCRTAGRAGGSPCQQARGLCGAG